MRRDAGPRGRRQGRRAPGQGGASLPPIARLVAVPTEVYVRKMKVQEALAKLERHLDMAWAAGLPWVRVIHGKGTGTLREAVWEYLRRHPAVSKVYPATPAEGGGGVTVAELRQR